MNPPFSVPQLRPEIDDAETGRITKCFLQNVARITSVPVCLRSQLAMKALRMREEPTSSSKRTQAVRSDTCQECGLRYDEMSARYSLRRERIKRRKQKNLHLCVQCLGCGKLAEPALVKNFTSEFSSKNVENDDDSEIPTISFKNARATEPHGRGSLLSNCSPAPSSRSSTGSSKTPSKSFKARKDVGVNKLRKMIAANSPCNTSLSDFLKTVSNQL